MQQNIIAEIMAAIEKEHAHWLALRMTTDDFAEKNIYATGEVTCERILHRIKQLIEQ